MKNYTYDFEIPTLITQFMSAIDDIIVKRYNNNKEPEQQIKVRFVYAPKQRVLSDMVDKAQNIQLPVVACYITGIGRDPSRVFNKIEGSYQPSPSMPGKSRHEAQPQPIDLNIGVTVMTRFQADMDQILGNLLPYFNPYIMISWRTPGRPDHEMRAQVVWSGQANITYPYDINAAQNARVVADLSFTLKGWLFQALDAEGTGQILTIHSLYSAEHHGIPCDYSFDQFVIDSSITDVFTLSGNPPQPIWIDPTFGNVGLAREYIVKGRGFTDIRNVYVSGVPFEDESVAWNPLSSDPLSAQFPAFTAVKVDTSLWSYDKNDTLMFVMPSAAEPGRVDVIVEGPRGYGRLTEFTRKNTYNPFLSSDPEYTTYIPYQVPYLSGVEIHP